MDPIYDPMGCLFEGVGFVHHHSFPGNLRILCTTRNVESPHSKEFEGFCPKNSINNSGINKYLGPGSNVFQSTHCVFFLQGNAMFVFGGKYINGDIVEASHTPQMAHGVSQVTNTLSEETPNTHRKSQKICENLLVWKKTSWRLFPGYIFCPSGNIYSFCVSFHISSICVLDPTPPSTAIQVLLRLLRDNNLPLLREAKGSVSPVDSRPQNTCAPCVLAMAEILWPVETDIVSISSCFFS